MANPNAPFGLKPISAPRGNIEVIPMTKTSGEIVYQFDAVNQVGAGTIEATATPGTTLYSGIALEGGIVAEGAKVILVVVNPNVIFIAQNNGSFAAADEGLSANLVLTAGNSTLRTSKHQIATSTADGTTATLDVHLRRLFPIEGNAYGNYAIVECSWNKHRQAFGVAGV